ncbi:MAG: homoserine O-acetyltransferase MetX [Opitutales bacterium]
MPDPKAQSVARELPPPVFRDFVSREPFPLELGGELPEVTLRYETYGTLLPDASNAVLVPHALSGDHHVAGRYSPEDRKPGWWDHYVGPGKAIDTDRFFVIGVNCLGGCRGSTGPASTDPRSGAPYGGYFPEITLGDIVRAQRLLVRHLGVRRLHAAVGGSMGGMQALLWCADYPAEVGRIVVLAAGLSQSPMAIALNAVARACIERDPGYRGGHYLPGEGPRSGLAVGRMLAHISYLSSAAFDQRFGRARVPGAAHGDPVHWQVESYLEHQGASFVRRFDANSLLRITRAVDRFDLTARAAAGSLFRSEGPEVLAVGFSSDWLYPTSELRMLTAAAAAAGVNAVYHEVVTDAGHDGFLLPDKGLTVRMHAFLG